MDPSYKSVVLIEDTSDNKHKWWQEPFDTALKGKYSLTFIEMCTTEPMKNLVIKEQNMLGVPKHTAEKKINDTIKNYVFPEGRDFPNIDFANIEIRISPIESATSRILFPSENSLLELGRRIFRSMNWTKYWISHWAKKTLANESIDTLSDGSKNLVINNKGTSNNFLNHITTEIMNRINM